MTATLPTSKLLSAAVGAVPGGMERPGQQQMADAIADAARREEHLLVQAGTGTGKSLAYLVPSLLVDGPVVVSTATLALQSQLVDHDLPRLADAVEPLLKRRPTFAVLKGRHHYVCLARLEGTSVEEPDDALFDVGEAKPTRWLGEAGRLGKHIERLRDWAMETDTGDRDELDPGVDDSAWKLVSMPARECVGAARCPYGAECFAEASRARAREADIVVTNHSLLAVDMLSGRMIIPPHKLLVVDEAHELADRVSSASQAELTPELLERAARRCRPYVDDDVADRLMEAGDTLTVALADAPAGRVTDGLPPVLGEALTLLDGGGRKAIDAIGEVKADDADPVRKQQAKTMVGDLTKIAQRILSGSEHDVTWIERDDRGRRAVVIAPLSVAGTLNTHLFHERTVVATSATLALGGQFDTVARSLGLPVTTPSPALATGASPAEAARDAVLRASAARDDADLAWSSLDVGSPFDYAKQGILYVAAHLPRPQTSGLSDPAATELVELVQALGGRTLGLFSSRKAAERAAEVLRARAPGITILLQGEESLPILVRKFREDRNSCLLGVMSLWQGVDVPGDACQLVVIDRLPFPRPDEPLAAARSAAVDSSGGSGFAAVSVPIAAVRLAQGVGRLIRARTDKGVVAVLDSRLETARGYGPYLRASLPPFWYTTKPDLVRGALRRLADS
ncbi:ATP-dependent DNA helicase [Dactylosporangium siamense]|uniref:ATP-dependent DNA helicase DinG n=2 Tax=Dactylosporangium siamense TaxID=685454 RepID=A0A919PUL4_9ACTN|nr:ATP-dependent DNA helicase DinG [Dactylosporangium siamense]